MYDYYLGGSHNYAADREAAAQVMVAIPNVREIARANRTFLHNAVKYLVDSGVHQFLDIGSGIPTVGNVHEIAQAAVPETRVVYVDIDPVAVAHSVELLKHNDRATAIQADLRYPDAILAHAGLRATLDLTRPVALIMASMLQFLSDEEAYPAVRTLRDVLAPGSHLALSHVAAEGMRRDRSDAAAEVYRQSTVPTGALRERRRIMEFFDGFTLVSPGLVWVSQWRPGPAVATEPSDHAEDIAILGGVGQLST
jgi:O-methyltransferase involved in polyketide biosynthesis